MVVVPGSLYHNTVHIQTEKEFYGDKPLQYSTNQRKATTKTGTWASVLISFILKYPKIPAFGGATYVYVEISG